MQDDQGNSQDQLPEGEEPEQIGAGPGADQPGASGTAGPGGAKPGEPGPVHGGPAFGQPGSYPPPGSYAQPSGSYGPPAGFGPPAGYDQPGGYGGYPGYGQPGGYGMPGYVPQPGIRARRRRTFLTYLTVAVVAAAASAGLTAYAMGGSSNATPSATGSHQPSGVVPGGPTSGVSGATVRAVVNKVRPGLVDITSNLAYQGSQAAATGMIISSNGLVLTNNHVINGTTQLYGTVLDTHQRFAARWLGYDATDDVAVIKLIGAHNLRTVPLGNSDTVKIGDHVIAIGNAYGADRNPAFAGSITGLNRSITASDSGAATKETLHDMLETNAGIVQGDSGGPLVSTAGRVIGMDTAAATGSLGTTPQNEGFAIPINRALRIARQIIAGQSSTTVQIGSSGFLGVLVPSQAASQASNPRLQRQRQISEDLGVAGGTAPPATAACLPTDLTAGVPSKVAPAASGALILGQLCATPADKAGIVAGDVITSVGGRKVTSPEDLTSVMVGFKPGQTVKVVWMDTAGRTHTASLMLISAPPH
ncbi:MAG TPA: trypsin-like peptidase domain-containing protein [Streptosporangiaceae bacterium]|nr:trypsin-like peptidase domain-containing protein [Streptosporangiaceae bacterium]